MIHTHNSAQHIQETELHQLSMANADGTGKNFFFVCFSSIFVKFLLQYRFNFCRAQYCSTRPLALLETDCRRNSQSEGLARQENSEHLFCLQYCSTCNERTRGHEKSQGDNCLWIALLMLLLKALRCLLSGEEEGRKGNYLQKFCDLHLVFVLEKKANTSALQRCSSTSQQEALDNSGQTL